MSKTNKIVEKVQGAVSKIRRASSSYTVKSLGQNIRKLRDLNMATPEELTQLKEIHKTITNRWLSLEMFDEKENENDK